MELRTSRPDLSGPVGGGNRATAGEDSAEGSEDQPISGLEVGPTDLAFEYTELVAESESLNPKRAIHGPSQNKEVEPGSEQGVEENQEHSGGSRADRAAATHLRAS
jgi:hypothetical protein